MPGLDITQQDNWICFEYDINIDEETAQDIQKDEGYHPSGYGFYDFKSVEGRTTWKCWNTCE